MEGNTTAPTNAPVANPAFDVPAFDARARYQEIHVEITDFLHYQSHVRLFAASSLPAEVPEPRNEDRNRIVDLLREENKRIKTLKWLLDIWEQNNTDILDAYCNAPTADPPQQPPQQQGWPGA